VTEQEPIVRHSAEEQLAEGRALHRPNLRATPEALVGDLVQGRPIGAAPPQHRVARRAGVQRRTQPEPLGDPDRRRHQRDPGAERFDGGLLLDEQGVDPRQGERSHQRRPADPAADDDHFRRARHPHRAESCRSRLLRPVRSAA
jgi:hypothetical protein